MILRRSRYYLRIVFLSVTLSCVYVLNDIFTEVAKINPLKLNYVVVHIDLKGAPPKLSFLKAMLLEIKSLGANALLMEYEDMFPYENELSVLKKPDHYKKNELKKFLIEAKNIGFEVIPLIQTFGHMEFVLKHAAFKNLSETHKSVESICPSKPGSLQLIGEILRQFINFHNSIVPLKHFHIGCDEVSNMNTCTYCKKRHMTKHKLYFNHVKAVSTLVNKLSPKTKILLWDDMLRKLDPLDWKATGRFKNQEPVYWDYRTDMKPHLPLFYYHKHFENIWIAAAFKGAEGKEAFFPNAKSRTGNILGWLFTMQDYTFAGEKGTFEFKGIFLTGWSRHKHFLPLCELLAVSYQNLVTSLILVQRFRNGTFLEGIKSPSTLQERVFIDYYNLVDCKCNTTYTKRKMNKCILKSSLSLSDSVKEFQDFLRHTTADVRVSLRRNPVWCLKTAQRLLDIEKFVQQKMERFYTWEVSSAYIHEKSSYVRKQLNDCINYK